MVLRFIPLILLLIFCNASTIAQTTGTADSVELSLKQHQSRKSRLLLLIQYSKKFAATDFRRALGYALEAIPIAEQSGSPDQLMDAIELAGNASYYLGLMEESAKYRARYLELVLPAGNPQQLAKAYSNLGGIWIAKAEFKKAGELFSKALKYLESNKNDLSNKEYLAGLVGIYNNLGIVYRETGDFTKAAEACSKGIDLAKNIPELQLEMIRLLNNYGELLMNNNNLADSRSALNEALNQSIQSGNKTLEAASLYNLSKLFEKTLDPDSSLSFARKGYQLAKELNQPDLIRGLAERLQEVYESAHRLDSSLHYLKIVQGYDQIIKVNEAKEVLLQQEMLADFRQKEQALESKHENEKLWLWLISGCILLIAVTLAWLFTIARNQVRKAEHEKLELELMAQTFEKEKMLLHAELETRNKELTGKVMMQIQRTELIEDIIKKLLEQSKSSGEQKSIVNELRTLREDDVWKEFDSRFTHVETAFFNKLRELFPGLTLNERRLCALLRMDMSTKEIAALTHQTIRGVELARIRLRKKLGLTNTEKSLTEFLAAL